MTRPAVASQAGPDAPVLAPWVQAVRAELVGNILPFWPRHLRDPAGGFFGLVHDDGSVDRTAPRGAVLNARILWTYASAARLVGPAWREAADWAFAGLDRFWDEQAGGLYWMLDAQGAPLAPRKQTYAQAFGIYGLAEYHRATGNAEALDRAKALYRLIERHCYDPVAHGYFEARDRSWRTLDDVRLSDKDLNAPKSMNTHLHVLEAYTNLLRVWPDEELAGRLGELLVVMLGKIVDLDNGRFRLFFDTNWKPIGEVVSFGHDIEGSWLLLEAAEVLGEPSILKRAHTAAVRMAEAVYAKGRDSDGSLFYEAHADGRILSDDKHWWVQAEAVIGFTNAYQITGDTHFLEAAERAWNFIERHMVDRVHGEWHAKTRRDGAAVTERDDPEAVLAGPWKCPYHNARLCYEITQRLGHKSELSETLTP